MEIRKIRGKKAQIEGNTLIYLLVALAILVLAFVLITNAFGLRDKFMGSTGKSNLDDKIGACNIFCTAKQEVNYNTYYDIIFADKTKGIASCRDLESTRSNGCALYLNSKYVPLTNVSGGLISQADCKGNWVKLDPKSTNSPYACLSRTNSVFVTEPAISLDQSLCGAITWIGYINQTYISNPCSF